MSFKYNSGKESAIKNIDLNIEGEKITALVGHSGAGKKYDYEFNTRFYQQQEGKIFVDDQDIQKVSLYSLRDKISLVSQDIILFDDTVENNIKFAKFDANEKEIKRACQLAAAEEFIETLPEKYQTIMVKMALDYQVAKNNDYRIARAILKNSPIILLMRQLLR